MGEGSCTGTQVRKSYLCNISWVSSFFPTYYITRVLMATDSSLALRVAQTVDVSSTLPNTYDVTTEWRVDLVGFWEEAGVDHLLELVVIVAYPVQNGEWPYSTYVIEVVAKHTRVATCKHTLINLSLQIP